MSAPPTPAQPAELPRPARTRAQRIALLLISLVVSGLFLALALRGVPLDHVWDALSHARPGWVLLSLALGSAGLFTRALRWQALLAGPMPLRHATAQIGVMFALNLLPLRAGEVARAVMAARRGVPFASAATSVIVERLLDTVVVIVLVLVSVAALPAMPPSVAQVTLLFALLAVVAFGVLLGLARAPGRAEAVVRWLDARFPLVRRLQLPPRVEQALGALRPLVRPGLLARVLAWTVVSWAFSVGMLVALHGALAVPATLNWWLSSILAISLATFTIAIPVTVAAVGPFEAAVRLSGEVMGMDALTATAMGFLFHGLQVLMYLLWGALGVLLARGQRHTTS